MANEKLVHKCVLCGSTSYEVGEDGVATCTKCGRRFVIQDDCVKYKILPELSAEQFLRKAWIYLAHEDIPLDVFKCDFDGVGVIEYQAIRESLDASVSYQVTVGYDREEPYMDTEKYSEREPYYEYERKYDPDTKTVHNVQVTRYRTVYKERQVLKYRPVTDWSPLASEHRTNSVAYAENGQGVFTDIEAFDGSAGKDDTDASGLSSSEGRKIDEDESIIDFDSGSFSWCFGSIGGDRFVAPSGDECSRMHITEAAEDSINFSHNLNIRGSVESSIGADRIRDLDCNINTDEYSTWLLLVPEYYSTLSYNGKKYTLKAFPFEHATSVRGEKIKNKEGLAAFESRRNQERDERKSDLRKSYDNLKWKKNRGLLVLATILLVLSIATSIVVSIFISSVAIGLTIVLALFVAAVVAFILSRVAVKNNEKRLDSEQEKALDKEDREARSAIYSYTNDYQRDKLKLLNEKFKKLGVDAATLDEIS